MCFVFCTGRLYVKLQKIEKKNKIKMTYNSSLIIFVLDDSYCVLRALYTMIMYKPVWGRDKYYRLD